MPFLGAGASRPISAERAATAPSPDVGLIDELVRRLDLVSDDARLFLEIAVAAVVRLNAIDEDRPPYGRVFEWVRSREVAPSAVELAQALAERADYDYFASVKARVAELTGRSDWGEAALTSLLGRLTGSGSLVTLLDASSYYANRGNRQALWKDLQKLFANKQRPTVTHALVAQAASRYLEHTRDDISAKDFLILTTNYDTLLELALDAVNVPYYVLTVLNREPSTVDVRLSSSAQEYLGMSDAQFNRLIERATTDRTTATFVGLSNKPRPLVVIYKMHGSLEADATADRDSVIITQEDYITVVSSSTSVPSYVRAMLPRTGFLLLGYSFSDWTVRQLSRYRPSAYDRVRDYAVVLNPSRYEVSFFERYNIDIFETDLDLFCQRMREEASGKA